MINYLCFFKMSQFCLLLGLGDHQKHTLFSVACFSFSTLAKVSSKSSISFFSSEHSSSSFLFLAVSSAFSSSSSSSLSLSSLVLASSKILFFISPSHRSSASAKLSLSYLTKITFSIYADCTLLVYCKIHSFSPHSLNLQAQVVIFLK